MRPRWSASSRWMPSKCLLTSSKHWFNPSIPAVQLPPLLAQVDPEPSEQRKGQRQREPSRQGVHQKQRSRRRSRAERRRGGCSRAASRTIATIGTRTCRGLAARRGLGSCTHRGESANGVRPRPAASAPVVEGRVAEEAGEPQPSKGAPAPLEAPGAHAEPAPRRTAPTSRRRSCGVPGASGSRT